MTFYTKEYSSDGNGCESTERLVDATQKVNDLIEDCKIEMIGCFIDDGYLSAKQGIHHVKAIMRRER